MNSLKSLSMLQIFGIVAGGLLLTKIMKDKVGIVFKDTATITPIIPLVQTPIIDVLQNEFSPVLSTTNTTVVTDSQNEIETPFNNPDILLNPNVVPSVQSLYTNQYFN